MDLNKRFTLLLGKPWHEKDPLQSIHCHIGCTCGDVFSGYREEKELFIHCKDNNPDFILHPTLVLVEMMKREDFPEFCRSITGIAFRADSTILMDVKYFLDTTEGLMARLFFLGWW